MIDYKSIEKQSGATIEIKKSVFICSLFPVEDEDNARVLLEKIKKEHFKANHNCYAYIIGENSDIRRSSDDGEPASTAGRPILSVLEKSGLTNVLAVVTRYFGGIKLGASGLLRAYQKAVTDALSNSAFVNYKASDILRLEFSYSDQSRIMNVLSSYGVYPTKQEYSEKAVLAVAVPKSLTETLVAELGRTTSGACSAKKVSEGYIKQKTDNVEEMN